MIYKIADFYIEINCIYPRTRVFLKDYVAEREQAADFTVTVTEEDIDREVKNAIRVQGRLRYSRIYLERLAVLRRICGEILPHGAFLMHGAAIEHEGQGYLFAAPAGVGKTTHILLWQELFGRESVAVINGDKPIIRLIDGKAYAYGTPWCGKEGFNEKRRTELACVCFLERARENRIEVLDESEALRGMLGQVMVEDSSALADQLELVGRLVEWLPMYRLHCNRDISAARLAYETLRQQ